MKKILLIISSLSLAVFCFANGEFERCEQLKQEIMKNPNVSYVANIFQYDTRSQDLFGADIYLKNGGYLSLIEFDRNLSGKGLSINYIGKDSNGTIEYTFAFCWHEMKIPDKYGLNSAYMDGYIKSFQLSCFLNKEISTINDIINNYNEIYALAEALAKETPEERSKRRTRHKSDDDTMFSDKLGNFETDEYWGQVFVKRFNADDYIYPDKAEPMFAEK